MRTQARSLLLFQFFALEAILGDKAEGLRALGPAFRRTTLGHLVSGHWTGPENIYYQYDKVRSAAVHGSEPPEVRLRCQRSGVAGVTKNVPECGRGSRRDRAESTARSVGSRSSRMT